MAEPHPGYTSEEIVRLGHDIYESKLRPLLEADNKGKFLVIDVETGEYEMDDDDLEASMRAFRKKPNGIRFGMRIGYEVSGTIGNAMAGRAR